MLGAIRLAKGCFAARGSLQEQSASDGFWADGTADIPAVLFSPPMGFYGCISAKLRGTKIGEWGGVTIPSAHQKKSLHTIKAPRITDSVRNRAGGFGKQTVLRTAQAFAQRLVRDSQDKAPTLDSAQAARLPTSFLQPFFFLAKKKVDRSPFPKEKTFAYF